MFKRILVPVDLAEPELARPAIEKACALAQIADGSIRIIHVLPMTPVMLAEYVPPDFDAQQRKSAEESMKALTSTCMLGPDRVSGIVRQGGIYHEVIEEAKAMNADLIVMTSHRPDMRSYFLGSNAGHVVRYANCSVLVLRD
jgi:nucleotide-binding universal stress UspA family protein